MGQVVRWLAGTGEGTGQTTYACDALVFDRKEKEGQTVRGLPEHACWIHSACSHPFRLLPLCLFWDITGACCYARATCL